ncbi:MAG: hypothetical protein U5Q44_12545 [Dehalococcoidia bacterium]|nr:hypothetical protein [Dehalococcoidia bacterium]
MTRKRLAFVAALIALLAAIPVATAVGQDGDSETLAQGTLGTAFTYQGQLSDGDAVADGSYDLRFILYDAASGGSQVGSTVEKTGVAVADGLFTVQLDFGAAAFSGDARWLEIAIRPDGGGSYTVLNPRQPITAAPYALHALSAGHIELPISASGDTAIPDALLDIEQQGTGPGIQVERTITDATIAPAIMGRNSGGGAGVQGTSDHQDGVGVAGLGNGSNGTGGYFAGEDTAVELDGGVAVSGDAPAAFVHEVTAGNLCLTGTGTIIDNPNANGNPDAMVLVTPSNGSQLPLGDRA